MRNYATQMEAARKGIITPEMQAVAKKEYRTDEEIRERKSRKYKHGKSVFGIDIIFPHDDPEDMSFEDMMASFKQSSDARMLDIKRNTESKRGSRRK